MSAVLLAVLLAAPERVVIVAKKREPPGVVARLRQSLARAGHRLYEREDDDVSQGNALAAQDDPEGALREYDRARARLPEDPRLAFDRAAVLLKLDPSKAAEAASEATQALQRGDADLKPKAAYHLALANEAMGHADEAVRHYGAALALDPRDTDSKVNLELLLRTQQERRQNPAGQPRPDQPPRQGDQPKPESQKGEAPKKREQSRPEDPGDRQKQQNDAQQRQDHAAQQEGRKEPEPQPQTGPQRATQDKPADRSEAQRLLDALRASEKNLQIWRFAKKKTEAKKRSDPDKDW
jgi:Ca-activated chloride channel homolog